MKKIAVGQMQARTLDVSRNLETMRQIAHEAGSQGVQILLLPELCATGYRADEVFVDLAQPLDGPIVQTLQALSKENNGMMIYTTIPEKREGCKPFNTAVLIGETGVSAVYRKIHLWGTEKEFFEAGDTPVNVDTPLGRAGLMVCFDVSFPELARYHALQGAQLLLYSYAFANPRRRYAFELLNRTRALENGCFVASANLVGCEKDTEFLGGSCVIDPAGQLLVDAKDKEGVFCAELDESLLFSVRQQYPYLKRRRADVYKLAISRDSKTGLQ